MRHGDISFNSILVQLEEKFQPHEGAEVNRFNSILVQLEACPPLCGSVSPLQFQFHIGAIRRRLDTCSTHH